MENTNTRKYTQYLRASEIERLQELREIRSNAEALAHAATKERQRIWDRCRKRGRDADKEKAK